MPFEIKEWSSDNTITTSSISNTIKIADTIFEDKVKDELQERIDELQEIIDQLQDQVLSLMHRLNQIDDRTEGSRMIG